MSKIIKEYTVKEYSKLHNIPTRTIYNDIYSKKVNAVKVWRFWKIREENTETNEGKDDYTSELTIFDLFITVWVLMTFIYVIYTYV